MSDDLPPSCDGLPSICFRWSGKEASSHCFRLLGELSECAYRLNHRSSLNTPEFGFRLGTTVLNPALIGAIAAISSIFGLLAFAGYLFFLFRYQVVQYYRDSSIRKEVEGSPIFNAGQVIEIIREFTSDESRLAALRQLAQVQQSSEASADRIYTKIRPTINMADARTKNNSLIRSGSLSLFVFLLAISLLGVFYALVSNDAVRSDFIKGYTSELSRIGSAIGINFNHDGGSERGSQNTITINDSVYAAINSPKRCQIYIRDKCNGREECGFYCSNFYSSCGDPDEGRAKECLVDYTCKSAPSKIIHLKVPENEMFPIPISCKNNALVDPE